jgi:Fur family transcriptional regulator, zinc uptake regulator
MTPVRRRVLEILLEEHKALGAYDVLARLAQEGFGNQPPVAYRALEFLVEQGLAHRIQRLNAFTACVHPGEDHAPAFLICRSLPHGRRGRGDRRPRLAGRGGGEGAGFQVERTTIEALGLCPNCRGQA